MPPISCPDWIPSPARTLRDWPQCVGSLCLYQLRTCAVILLGLYAVKKGEGEEGWLEVHDTRPFASRATITRGGEGGENERGDFLALLPFELRCTVPPSKQREGVAFATPPHYNASKGKEGGGWIAEAP